MVCTRRKILVLAAVSVLVVSVFSAIVIVYFGEAPQKTGENVIYLSFNYEKSGIAVLSSNDSFALSNQTFTSADGHNVAQGSIYTINLTLRNDYSSDNPPPSTGTPVSDGTAYICLRAFPLVYDVAHGSVNLSPSDFTPPSTDQTGLILASGQTRNVQLVLATNLTSITGYIIKLESVTDNIPR